MLRAVWIKKGLASKTFFVSEGDRNGPYNPLFAALFESWGYKLGYKIADGGSF